jgi:hypothetical protein
LQDPIRRGIPLGFRAERSQGDDGCVFKMLPLFFVADVDSKFHIALYFILVLIIHVVVIFAASGKGNGQHYCQKQNQDFFQSCHRPFM